MTNSRRQPATIGVRGWSPERRVAGARRRQQKHARADGALDFANAPYPPGNRGLWLKVKCLHREEFVVICWTDPEGARPFLGALLLGHYDPDGRLIFAGRVGSGINQTELERLWQAAAACDRQDAARSAAARSRRFGSPLVLSRVHWVRPELVAEVKYLAWTGDNLLRQVVYEGLREDKPAAEVRREVPRAK